VGNTDDGTDTWTGCGVGWRRSSDDDVHATTPAINAAKTPQKRSAPAALSAVAHDSGSGSGSSSTSDQANSGVGIGARGTTVVAGAESSGIREMVASSGDIRQYFRPGSNFGDRVKHGVKRRFD
jgi:hypothetical protein